MARENSLVQRLIAFLKKPDALEYDQRDVRNPYDDFEARKPQPALPQSDGAQRVHPSNDYVHHHAQQATSAPPPPENRPPQFSNTETQTGHQGSRLDALVMRALQQFNAQYGYVLRTASDGRMHYCTGRDQRGRFIAHTEAAPDRRAVFLALDSGESQFFVHTQNDSASPTAILCGPLWDENGVIGVLYLDSPARNRLHRGVFDVYCEQAARMLTRQIS
jgi:hypothetical protein